MNPATLELDALERRRRQWRRLARPQGRGIDVTPAHGAAESFVPGYPSSHLLLRALLPLALAILVFLINSASRSDTSNPRGQARSELHSR